MNERYPALQLPPASLELSKKDGELFVRCIVRKKALVLTPEEWVRQHLIHYLVHYKNIPLGYISSEVSLKIRGQQRRCDVLIRDKNGTPWLVIECKAPNVSISDETFVQTSNYVREIGVPYLLMSNGLQHTIMVCATGVQLTDLPEFEC